MARPRKNQEGPSAVERMETAFWNILAEKPYVKISVSEIAQRARVNKNAFYYHFTSLHVLAEQAIDNTIPRDLAKIILMSSDFDSAYMEALSLSEDFKQRSSKIRLIAGDHGSRELAALLKDRILHAWFDIFDVQEDELDRETMMAVEFVLGGLVELIGNDRFFESDKSLHQVLLDSDIMRTTALSVAAALRNAASTTHNP